MPGDSGGNGRGGGKFGDTTGAPPFGTPEFWTWYNAQKNGGAGTTPSTKPVYPNAPVEKTFQPTLPGFMDMHANQLAAGFGGDPSTYAAQLNSMYQPMSVTSFSEPISTTAEMYKPASKGKKGRTSTSQYAPISTGSAMLDKLLMGEGAVGFKSKGSKGGADSRGFSGDEDDENAALSRRVSHLERRTRA